jgi:hypothetical protein
MIADVTVAVGNVCASFSLTAKRDGCHFSLDIFRRAGMFRIELLFNAQS